MMQYLLTIVFLICTFWVVVGVLYFIYGKRGSGKTTTDDDSIATTKSTCPGTADGGRSPLSSGKTVICSVRQSNARELWVFLPEGICSVFVALGLTLSDGTVQQGYALSVERLRAVDKVKALVSVDYSVLISSTDRFKNSLNDFMRNVPAYFARKFNGIEVRGVPVDDYLVDSKMSALNNAIGTVKSTVTQVTRVVVTIAIPLTWQAPGGKLTKSNALAYADTTVAQIHYLPPSGGCTARPSNSLARMQEVKGFMSSWSAPCLSMMLGGIIFNGASGAGAQSGTCQLYRYCKVRDVSGMNCLYVDNIDLDDAKCRCQKQEQFPLLSRVKRGLSARSAGVHR